MSRKYLAEKQSIESNELKNDEVEFDLKDILCKIIGIRKTIYKATVVGVVIGIIVALSTPKQYAVKVTLSPEVGSSKGNNGLAGIAASFLGNGVSMGEGVDALNLSLAKDIVSSTPFLLELLDIKVPVYDSDKKVSLSFYLEKQSAPWWSYIIGLPSVAIGEIQSLFVNNNRNEITNERKQVAIQLTKDESSKINILKKNITVSIDKKTGITNVSVIFQEPIVTAVMADTIVHKLQEYIIDYRTSKSKEDCVYWEKIFKERKAEYYAAQKKYADYVDTHDNLILQGVRTEQERLQNDMNLAYQVYTQVANQLQVAKAKVQEEKPVFAVVEPAVVPLQPIGIGLKMYILLFVLVAVFSAVLWDLLVWKIFDRLKNVENK